MKTRIKTKKKKTGIVAIVIILLVIAWLCRVSRSGIVKGWIRCAIQCSLLAAWALSVQKRIISERVRSYLSTIAALFIFWTIEVMVKYTILPPYPNATRYAWYLYYIPITLVPVLALFSALHVGRPEDYKLPAAWNLLLLPAFLCIALVLTNDFHQIAFSFPGGVLNSGTDYTQGPGFYITMGIVLSEAAMFFAVLFRKCRLAEKGKRILFPFIPIIVLLIYAAVYIIDYDLVAVVAGDMKSVNVYAIVLTLELCIYKGLFPSNTHYEDLFAISSVCARITDEEYNTILCTGLEPELSRELLQKTKDGPVILDGYIRLSGKPLKDGHVLWTEDLSELAEAVSELRERDEELAEKEFVLREEYETSHLKSSLEERNRLYNSMQERTKKQLSLLPELLSELKAAEEPGEAKRITTRLAVITAYIKRRNNLFFLSEENRLLPIEELSYSINESLGSLALSGAECNLNVKLTWTMPFETMLALYDAFESLAELVMDSLEELFVTVSVKGGAPALLVSLSSGTELYPLEALGFTVTAESEGEWSTEYVYKEGGEALC